MLKNLTNGTAKAKLNLGKHKKQTVGFLALWHKSIRHLKSTCKV